VLCVPVVDGAGSSVAENGVYTEGIAVAAWEALGVACPVVAGWPNAENH
jgi:hypothetical protein